MKISKSAATDLIREISSVIDYDINIMNENGVILASTDKERVGQFHEGAHLVIKQNLKELPVYYDEEYAGCRQGINLPLFSDDNIIGVVGITGDVSETGRYARLIKKVTEDLEDLKLNTSIAAFMGYVKKIKDRGYITKEELRIFLILLNPLAPHITSEIYEKVFNKNILNESWPTYDETKLNKDSFTMVVQVNGKVRGKITASSSTSNEEMLELAKTIDNVKLFIDNKEIIKVITVPKKLVNIVVK